MTDKTTPEKDSDIQLGCFFGVIVTIAVVYILLTLQCAIDKLSAIEKILVP